MWRFELAHWKAGVTGVVGVDEAGRGPLAGPVVAAAVQLPPEGHPGYRTARRKLRGLNDSKQLTPEARDAFFEVIGEVALGVGVGIGSVALIDDVNILQATFWAMRRALADVAGAAHVLVDGNRRIPEVDLPQEALVKGDARSASIAAASVVAKVTRDRLMVELDGAYPAYGFAQHKGYCTLQHVEAIHRHGPTPEHRKSFRVPEAHELRGYRPEEVPPAPGVV